jgi:choline dehydrogenase-like flavoprotein
MIEASRILLAAGARRLITLQLAGVNVGDGARPITPSEFERFLEETRRAGAAPQRLSLFSAHPCGSARAGTDGRSSAANGQGEVHGIRNLFIGDGSLLPTAAGVNPMVSIMGLSLRTAGFIDARLRAAA